MKQKLGLACTLVRSPELLLLGEPTVGVDPLSRRELWEIIFQLVQDQGLAVLLTTSYLNEAERCAHVVVLHEGKVLAEGRPTQVSQLAAGRTYLAEPPAEETARRLQARLLGAPGVVDAVPEGGSVRFVLAGEMSDDLLQGATTIPAQERFEDGFMVLLRRTITESEPRLFRDPSSVGIGVVMPVMLILLFGYGLSLDVKDAPLAVVLEDPSSEAAELAAGFQLSPYFDAQLLTAMPQAQERMLARKVDGIVRIRPDFARNLALGSAEVQILVHGTDANRARIIQGYAQGAVSQWAARRAAEGRVVSAGPVIVQDRLWFNEANDSHYFLVPGLVVLVMTLIGAMLTTLVMAREWERGTFEALFVTPVRVDEILLGKTIPYFALGMSGLALCVLAAKFLFHVPIRGSIGVLAGASMLYLLVALAIGLLISSATKSQFVASQLTMLVTFLPAFMLSGFLFDLRNMPAAVRLLTYALPARYYVALLQTIFLAGDVWDVILPNAAALAAMATVLLLLTRAVTRKKLA